MKVTRYVNAIKNRALTKTCSWSNTLDMQFEVPIIEGLSMVAFLGVCKQCQVFSEPGETHSVSAILAHTTSDRSQILSKSSLDDNRQQPPPQLYAVIMATELTVQSERAFQKQPHIFLNSKAKKSKSKVGKGGRRWFKDVGLGFKTPRTAIEGSYIGMWRFGCSLWNPCRLRQVLHKLEHKAELKRRQTEC